MQAKPTLHNMHNVCNPHPSHSQRNVCMCSNFLLKCGTCPNTRQMHNAQCTCMYMDIVHVGAGAYNVCVGARLGSTSLSPLVLGVVVAVLGHSQALLKCIVYQEQMNLLMSSPLQFTYAVDCSYTSSISL